MTLTGVKFQVSSYSQIKNLKILYPILGLTTLLIFPGCATTEKTSEWRDQAFADARFDDILVIGVSQRKAARRMFESNLVTELQKRNVRASPSFEIMAVDAKIDRQTVRAAIVGKEIDAILVTHLVGIEEKQHYVPPTTIRAPRYYGYYSMAYDRVYEPGYYERYDVVKLETSLYEARTEKLVWSMGSDTIDLNADEALIKSVDMVNALGKQDLI